MPSRPSKPSRRSPAAPSSNRAPAPRGNGRSRSDASSKTSTPALPRARSVALHALELCLGTTAHQEPDAPQDARNTGRDAQAALDRVLTREPDLAARDAALATELVYGTLRCKTRLEYILTRFLDRPEKLPPAAMTAMTVATYELFFLDRVPARASVNWGVDAVRSACRGGLGGLANAVLRKVAALAESGLPEHFFGPDQEPETLARAYACPLWIVELWLDEYGPEATDRLLKAQMQPPALGVAVRHDQDAAESQVQQLAREPGCLAVDGLGVAFAPGAASPLLSRLLAERAVVRQSFAGRQALKALEPASWPDPVWDACAGRGGKTRLLLEWQKDVQASDIHRGRIRALQKELPGVPAQAGSALERPPFDRPARTILLDAPCSGLGTLARRPDIKWKRTEEDVDALVDLQARLLAKSWRLLAPGGQLAYLTCTLNPDENERQVHAFLADHPQATLRTEWTTPWKAPWGEFFYAALIIK